MCSVGMIFKRCRLYSRKRWRRSWPCLLKNRTAIACQVLDFLADKEARRRRFSEKREVIRRMAREGPEEDERGQTLPLNDIL